VAATKPQVELYTDGACSGNPGPGGWAYILALPDNGVRSDDSGGDPATTNNRMELISVIQGLNALDRPCVVDLYSDSQYVTRGLSEWLDQWKSKGWRRRGNAPVKNLDLWQELDRLREVHELRCHWIRGHSDHPENEQCDRMAVKAMGRYRK
jgi:ribonuclease HI